MQGQVWLLRVVDKKVWGVGSEGKVDVGEEHNFEQGQRPFIEDDNIASKRVRVPLFLFSELTKKNKEKSVYLQKLKKKKDIQDELILES